MKPALVTSLGHYLIRNLQDRRWTTFRAAVAYVRSSGTQYYASRTDAPYERITFCDALNEFSERSDIELVRMSVGIKPIGSSQEKYDGTSKEGLEQLLDPSREILVYRGKGVFHPKMFLFKNDRKASVLVGSGNLTFGGLYDNVEVGLSLSLDAEDDWEEYEDFVSQIEGELEGWEQLCDKLDSALLRQLQVDQLVGTEQASRPADLNL